MAYNERIIDQVLDELLPSLPAILLDGPKAVGKTTTGLQRANTVKRLDRDAERLLVRADPSWVLKGEKPILLDEWQKTPEVWGRIKDAVDSDYSGGQFILTGSMPNHETHSGAGRITAIRMRPLSFAERNVTQPSISFRDLLIGNAGVEGHTDVGIDDYCAELMHSGFPAIRTLQGNALRVALDGYIERVVDADVREMGLAIRKPASLKAWMTAYAAATATTASWEALRDAANTGSDEQPAKTTILSYRDALTRLRILDELPAWLPTRNQFARVSQAAKHFLADPALAMRLMNYDAETVRTAMSYGSGTYDGPLVGRLFEALVVLSVRTYADASFAKAMHFRERDGRHEVDLIVERQDGKVLAIEVKLSATISDDDVKHLKWLKREIGDDLIDSVVIYAGEFAYRRDGIALIPLAMLGA